MTRISPESKSKAAVIESHCLAAIGQVDAAIDLLGDYLPGSAPDSAIREHLLRLRVMRFENDVLSLTSPTSEAVERANSLVSDIDAFTDSLTTDDESRHIDATMLRASVYLINRQYRKAYQEHGFLFLLL